ncbi:MULTISPECIES: heme-binding protein [Pseudomonas]|uniref:GlcG/HbpS family heme-binding protein n=1 Tax=Pseudomonas TaxID=286 RepID=UPI000C883830|nr:MULTISPECIES: heme-binding protein [Pseudomonas]PNA03910.1 heme-binding protein [Pseudomonas sp. FW305-BF15]PNB48994.1 heme-binding protein [Pseudomonas sp. GW456-12-10-14-LB2]PNB78585.1 heme-binding protein [Pseudomonas sp. FW305-BF6]TEA61276.1 heme-binding protein [Pseudomonas sp. CH235]
MSAKYLVASLAIGLGTAAIAAPELPRHADLDLKTARLLADTALENCTGTVSVLDRGGNLLVTLRGDGIGPHNTVASQRKAYTALSTKTPTRLFAERARSNPETANLNTLDELLLLGGGIPLFAGKELVGAMGVAGSGGGEQDENCAIKAADIVGLSINRI